MCVFLLPFAWMSRCVQARLFVAVNVCIFQPVCLCMRSGTSVCVSARAHACECVCWHKRLLCALGVNWLRSFVNILLASLLVRSRAGKLMSV